MRKEELSSPSSGSDQVIRAEIETRGVHNSTVLVKVWSCPPPLA